MPRVLDPELRHALEARIRYYNEMGIYDFYRRPSPETSLAVDEAAIAISDHTLEPGEEMSPRKATAVAVPVSVDENIFEAIALKPEQRCERSREGAEDHPRRPRRLHALRAP
jgi:hypothetical protein